jgi:hypothetical protein
MSDGSGYRASHRLVETYDDGSEHMVCCSDSQETLEAVGRRRRAAGIAATFRVEPNSYTRPVEEV